MNPLREHLYTLIDFCTNHGLPPSETGIFLSEMFSKEGQR